MSLPLLRVSLTTALIACTCLGAEQKQSFPEQVKQLFAGQWTDMTITTALVTDYKVVIATSIHLKRPDKAKPPLASSTASGSKEIVLTDKDWKTLCDAVAAAAKTMFEHKYPLEIYNSLPSEEAQKLLESGQLKINATDVEVLQIRASTPKGKVELNEYGPYAPLDAVMQRMLKVKARELKSGELKSVLGQDPYEEVDTKEREGGKPSK